HVSEKPDLVLPMRGRPFVVPKDGVIEYQYFVVDPGFEEDKWIERAVVLPGAREVVHHVIVFVRPPDGTQFEDAGWLAGYVPGRKVSTHSGHARKITAGSKFVFQMHYAPNGTERKDLTRLAIKFADEENVTHRLVTILSMNQDFEIPPNDPSYIVHGDVQSLPEEATLISIYPHMHVRGKSFKAFVSKNAPQAVDRNTAKESKPCPSEQQEQILSVPSYDFNWQHNYFLKTPIPIKSLANLSFEVRFDNSPNNPFNPNPEETVFWGAQSWEEMVAIFWGLAIPREASGHLRRMTPEDSTNVDEKIAAYVKRVLSKMDNNQDGKIEESEGSVFVRHFNFNLFDWNADGVVTRKEIEEVAALLYD
ncbi:MAG: alkyl hydroperoxide reductase, partial [Planctomycetota bacterium]